MNAEAPYVGSDIQARERELPERVKQLFETAPEYAVKPTISPLAAAMTVYVTARRLGFTVTEARALQESVYARLAGRPAADYTAWHAGA